MKKIDGILIVLAIVIIISGIVAGIVVSNRSTVNASNRGNASEQVHEIIHTENQVSEYKNNENKNNISSVSENEIAENKVAENKVTENKVAENTTKENNIEENKSTEKEETKEKTAATEGKKGTIYLTFDDGPSKDITPGILDILKKENVKATFFILNYNSTGEELVKRELEEGHSVGIHGWSHKYSEIYQNEETYMQNLDKLQEKIKNSTGVTTKITRFPGGSSNTVSKKYNEKDGLMSRLVKLVQEKGYKYYDWNVDSEDAGSAKNKTQVYNNVTKRLSKKRPNIVLMHDKGGNKKTLNALENIIQFAKENGYEFETITYEGNVVSHHNVNN